MLVEGGTGVPEAPSPVGGTCGCESCAIVAAWPTASKIDGAARTTLLTEAWAVATRAGAAVTTDGVLITVATLTAMLPEAAGAADITAGVLATAAAEAAAWATTAGAAAITAGWAATAEAAIAMEAAATGLVAAMLWAAAAATWAIWAATAGLEALAKAVMAAPSPLATAL